MCASFGIVYTLLSAALMRRYFACEPSPPVSFPPITVIKPLHGHEAALLANLSSFCRQDYPGPVQYLFGTHSDKDAALDAVTELRKLHPQTDITAVANSELHGPNRKVSNLINLLPAAKYDLLVFADSDVGVHCSYLRDVVGALQQPGISLVTCLYRGRPDPGFWPRLSAMATNHQHLPGIVTGLTLGLAHPCLGQTIALRRETLEEIGGMKQFGHHLAEDHAIGAAVRGTGGKIAIPPFVLAHGCMETSARQFISHELRWSRTIQAVDPLGHLGSVLAHPLPLALLAAAFSGFQHWAVGLVVAAIIVRAGCKLLADRWLRQPQQLADLCLQPACDVALFAILVGSFFCGRVMWRGHHYQVSSEGRLSAVGEDTPADAILISGTETAESEPDRAIAS